MKKSKKAMVAQEVLRIVIAVACIFLLVYMAVKLYEIFTLKGDLEKARAELANIGGKIDVVMKEADSNTNGTASTEYLLLSPQNWMLTGWPYQSSSSAVNVQYCISQGWKKCLCMCDVGVIRVATIYKATPSNVAESCDANKVCIEVKADSLKVNPTRYLWGLFGSDLAPIYIKQLNQDFKGDLNITYNKNTKELSIIPKQK